MSDSAETPYGGFWADADDEHALQRYRSLVQAIDEGIFQLDDESRVTAVNDAVLERTGYSREDLLGEHVSLLLDEGEYRRIERELAGRPASDDDDDGDRAEPIAVTVRTDTGGTVPCELRRLPPIDEGSSLVGIVRDSDGHSATVDSAERRDLKLEPEREREREQEQERKRELEEREQRLASLIDNVPGMVYRCRNERGWPMEFVSDACEEVTGYDADALERGDVEWGGDVMVQNDREMLWETVQETAGEGETFSETYRIETPDGERRWVRDYGRGIFEDGDLVEIEGIISDITDRKRAEQRLAEERDMFADGPAVVFRWKPDEEEGWPVEYVSPNVEDVFGYAPAELESGAIPYADLLFDDEIERIAREVAENSDETTERFSHEPYRVKTKGGGVRWVKDTTKIVRDEAGEITDYLGYLVDITERKERERELQQYETIVETISDGVYVVDEDGRFTMVNDAYVELTGYDREELLGEHVSLVVDEDVVERAQQTESAMQRADTDSPTIEAELRTADGGRLTAEATFALLPGPDGGTHRVGVARDITERKERERRLEESNERLEQFAYAASHDLQEPLRMVSSYLQLIEDRYADDLDADGQEFLGYAVDGADRMREMIQGLLAYSRVETRGDPLEPVDLDAVLSDVLDDLQVKRERSDADVTTESLPAVEGDASQLRQVFQNLLENALEYSGDESPRVHVGAERREARRVSDQRGVAAESDGLESEWVLSVRDEGIGIDPADQDRIFEVFERLHSHGQYEGTGIGLALCERIVERHGGDIWVDSEPGEGTTVSFTLPAADDGNGP